jgi:hypothetical protein
MSVWGWEDPSHSMRVPKVVPVRPVPSLMHRRWIMADRTTYVGLDVQEEGSLTPVGGGRCARRVREYGRIVNTAPAVDCWCASSGSVPVGALGGIGVRLTGIIPTFFELLPSPPPETAVKFSREGGTGRDASEAVRAAVRGVPPEDGFVPLQLPLSCADHCIEARREGCHLREIEWDPATGDTVCELSDNIAARQIVVRSAPEPPALRLRRTAHAAAGLDRSARSNEEHPRLDGNIYCRSSTNLAGEPFDRKEPLPMPT